MNPSLILFFNIVAWAWLAYMVTGLLLAVGVRAYLGARGRRVPDIEIHWAAIPSVVAAAAWLSVFSGLSFGG